MSGLFPSLLISFCFFLCVFHSFGLFYFPPSFSSFFQLSRFSLSLSVTTIFPPSLSLFVSCPLPPPGLSPLSLSLFTPLPVRPNYLEVSPRLPTADKEAFISVLSAAPYGELHQKHQVSYNGWRETVVPLCVSQ